MKGDIEREKVVKALVAKYAEKRKELKKKIKDLTLSPGERIKSMMELDALPKRSSKTMVTNRCSISGSSRSYFGFFGISRHVFRRLASQNLLPGVKKHSW